MSEAAIFSVGAVMFVMTAWASMAFGLRRAHELGLRDLEASGRIADVEDRGLTEIHRTAPPRPTE